MKKMLLAALAATTLFSCSDEHVDNTEKGTASLYMSIRQGSVTRAVDNAGSTATAGITELYVQPLTASSETSGSLISITANTSPSLEDVTYVSGTNTGTDAKQIIRKNIAIEATDVLVYGFKGSKPANFNIGNYDGTKNINTLQGTGFSFLEIPYVTLSNGSYAKDAITKTNLTPPTGKTGQVWTVSPTIAPYFARFEISGTPATGTGIKKVTVDQIYLNNFAATHGATPVIHPGNLAYFTYDESGNITGTTGGGASNNDQGDWGTAYYVAASNTMYGAPAETGKVQGFNLYAQGVMPHVVLKVTVVPATSPDNESLSYTGFVTINGFKKNVAGGDTAVSAIATGKVYQLTLNGLTITKAMVNPEPEHQGADLYMTIKVTDWELIQIVPN